jgi:SAM-dependent methyltransferase
MSRDWEDAWHRHDTLWDKGAAAPPLLEYLEQWDHGFVRGSRLLVPGCGSGHDVRALAAAGAEVVGLDIAATAVRVARDFKPSGSESYVHGDLFEWDGGCFDGLWEHTCFCAIEPGQRDRYAEAAARLIRPGGRLVGVFFLNPENDGDGPPFGATREEIVGHLAPHFELIRSQVPERAYPGRMGREWLAHFERRAEPASR